MVGAKDIAEGAKWVWENRKAISDALATFYRWWKRSRILIIGPGGTGKTTLARMLSGEFDWLKDSPWLYTEDVRVDRFKLKADPAAEVMVLPGQEHRRHSTWAGVGQDLAKGVYRGVILASSYGYHSLSRISYKQHQLYEPERDKDTFLKKYLGACREDEVGCLKRLVPFLKECPRKLWLVSVATKQDLWRTSETAVRKWYSEGEYGSLIAEIVQHRGTSFQHEWHPLSLVIGNFVTARDEPLANNLKGYDHRSQVESVRRLIEVIDGLRKWGSEK